MVRGVHFATLALGSRADQVLVGERQGAQALTVVDLTNAGYSETAVAVQVCAGLYNRDAALGRVYVLGQQGADSAWLKDLEGIEEPEITDA
jgi:hypothetical protein